MSKLIVETTGSFMLVMHDGDVIQWNRPSVVRTSTFLQERIANGQIRVLIDDVPDTATDEAFAEFFADSKDLDSAAANYFSSLEKDEDVADSSSNEDVADKKPAKKATAKKPTTKS
jgi:hypothetical protein